MPRRGKWLNLASKNSSRLKEFLPVAPAASGLPCQGSLGLNMRYHVLLKISILFIFFLGSVFSPSDAADFFPYKDVGDGNPATSVILTLVDGVVVDPDGNIYLSHRSKNRIRKITPDGIITTIAGNGTAGYSGDGGPALEAALGSLLLVPADAVAVESVGAAAASRAVAAGGAQRAARR